MIEQPPRALVWRQVPFSLEAFDRFKDWQRHWERTEGRRMSNGEALDRLILVMPAPPAAPHPRRDP